MSVSVHPDAVVPCDAPKPFVDFSGRLYGAHEIARNMGTTCPHCGTTFEFWGDLLLNESGVHGNLARLAATRNDVDPAQRDRGAHMSVVTIDRDFERHGGDSRPKILLPGGGHAYYTRVTTFVDCIEDKYMLHNWEKRMVAIGLSVRPDLLLSAQAHMDEKRKLDAICRDAKEAGLANAASNTGTALHKLTDMLDRGQELPPVHAGAKASLEMFRKATADLEVLAIEKKLVSDWLKCAGTADRIYEFEGKHYIGDTKSGKGIDLGIVKIAAQLALYAHSHAYDVDTGERNRLDVELDRAIVMHMPSTDDPAQARCELYWVDIAAGWRAVLVARQVRAMRAMKMDDLTQPFANTTPFVTPDSRTDTTLHQVLAGPPALTTATDTISGLVASATTIEELHGIFEQYRDDWQLYHSGLADARKRELGIAL